MWYHYKRMFYRAAAPDPGPAATAFMVMQVGAVAGSLWVNRLRGGLTSGDSRFLN